MGSAAKQRPGGLYGMLLRVYPQRFRKHYGPTMAQTLDDMLADEPSRTGRLAVWARTLADLPVSATREHISDGKGIRMSRNMQIVFIGVVAALLLANFSSFWFGMLHARQTASIMRATPMRLADAMQHDEFYSDYGDAALLFDGKVTRVQQHGNTQSATFYTGHAYTVTCEFLGPERVKPGQQVSVVATGGNADRQPHGVLLHNCIQN